MGFRHYLAMTAAELRLFPQPSEGIAWMGCHFSPYATHISNLPPCLPPGSVVILDDITPIHGHDPQRIGEQFAQCLGEMDCAGVLLDFQRPGYPEAARLADYLSRHLACPVGVSALYGEGLTCPVFLPPPPHHIPLAEHLAPWQGREIWLEGALDAETLTLTPAGCTASPLPGFSAPGSGFLEESLHCHYRIETPPEKAVFTLWRTREDLTALLAEAEALGVTCSLGLYQELGHDFPLPKDMPCLSEEKAIE